MTSAPRRGRRTIVAAMAISVLVGVGSWALDAFSGRATAWAGVERNDLTLTVEMTGTLQAVETDLLGPPKLRSLWQYKIAFMAPEGEAVREGDRVLAFDVSELEQRLQQEIVDADLARKRVEKVERESAKNRVADELELGEARARARKAVLKVERPDEVVAVREQAIARLELELAEKEESFLASRLESARRAAEANLEVYRDRLAQKEQEVRESRSAIAQMVRQAPRAGTVIYVTNWRDEKKSVGDTAWRGETVIELPDLSLMKAMAQVHEADAGRLEEGQKATLRLDAHPDIGFSGRIARIWRTVQKESWRSELKVVRVEIELDETDTRKMRPGMRFRGEIEVERIEDALLVDADAVFLRPEGPVVYRKSWRGSEPVSVELGRRSRTEVEVIEGLVEGDLVTLSDPAGPGAGS
jgi:HlyD family secretion protein